MRRRVLPVTAAAALVASAALTGCSAAQTAEACEPLLAPGALSDSVEVSGDSADSLQVSLSEGSEVLNAQRSIVRSVDEPGAVVSQGSIVGANLAYVDSSSGEILEAEPAFGSGEGGRLFLADPAAGTLIAGVVCAAVGDTVAVALSPEESAMMGVDGSLVLLAEITSAAEPRATGKTRALPSGFPAVTTDETGRPGLVLPPQKAPSGVRSAPRIEGDGEKVTAEHTVIGQVLTVGWDGVKQKNTWEAGPESFGTEAEMEQSQASFRAELTGYPVGSQVVVIENGEAGSRVSVVDILAVA